MAMYHFCSKIISRGKNQSIVASAAYRSGEKISDERSGKEFDFSRKEHVSHSEILLPRGAPDRFRDRGTLWNEIEKIEKRNDAQLGREIEAAIPIELDEESRLRLVMDFLREEIVSQGMIADFSLHDLKGNPHFHALLSMRDIEGDGFGKKNRSWNQREFLNNLRKRWADHVNRALERAGVNERVDHRSYKARGIEQAPTIHEGWKARRLEKARPGASDRIAHNRRVKYWNLKHKNLISSRKNLLSSQKDLIGDRNNINDSFTKEAQKCGKILDKISKGTLKNLVKSPVSKVVDQIKKLFQMALAGNQEAADVLGFHFSRVPELAENYGTPWEWLTELQKSEEKEKRFWRSIDDY